MLRDTPWLRLQARKCTIYRSDSVNRDTFKIVLGIFQPQQGQQGFGVLFDLFAVFLHGSLSCAVVLNKLARQAILIFAVLEDCRLPYGNQSNMILLFHVNLRSNLCVLAVPIPGNRFHLGSDMPIQ